jgi:predicted transcriptional regulator
MTLKLLWIVGGVDMKKWRTARKRLRMTQFELSAKSGVPRWRIAYCESGYLRLRRDEMRKIRLVLAAA